ncbi:hypothetical protein BDV96DRAFT_100221 [Lophiotrema nucula]|uniref:Uncharacterized protein n=1 Tax=Lophiotrema nucula TaxID=690887 RepID=A0A6A5Z810_9PLEO|nr:hypothetical protein BDV96DRAFT_100221 [Lophiotrema nucula]
MPPSPTSAFLSLQPLEPVLVFQSSQEAALFQSRCTQGRILPNQRHSYVFLPMPEGLMRVRTSRNGDVGFDFERHSQASAFNSSLKGIGRIFPNTRDRPIWDRSVYLGKQLK